MSPPYVHRVERIGRYEIVEELGRGAMGAVYKARDPEIGRVVAIKTILTSGLDSGQLREYKRRFYREAQTAGRLAHPGIVTIYDIAEDGNGQPYLVMEFIEGATLHRILRSAYGGSPERIPLETALDLAEQIADALDDAHRHGVVHRDVKPANVLVTPEGRARIADFGVAKFTDIEATRTAAVMGTPAYMAPEQLRGGNVDARSDIFSFGAMLYWMVTGQKPFIGEDLTAVSFKVVYTDPPRPTELDPGLPRDLDVVVSRCLAKNRADRYTTARELARDLHAVRTGTPIATTAAPRANIQDTVTTFPPAPAPPVKQTGAPPPKRTPSLRLLAVGFLVLSFAVVVLQLRPMDRVVHHIGPGPDTSTPTLETTAPLEIDVAPPAPEPRQVDEPAPRHMERQVPIAQSPVAESVPAPPEVAESHDIPVLELEEPALPIEAALPDVHASSLHFECRHDFRSATLRISSIDTELLVARLEKRGRWILSSGGKLESSVPLPLAAGPQELRVRVRSVDEKQPFDQEAYIHGDFPEGGSRRLVIEFPEEQLRLRWAD